MGSRSKAPKQEPTEQERALADIAAAKHERFKAKGIPLENEYIEATKRIGGARETDTLVGTGVATVQQAAAGAGDITETPGSGGFVNRLTRTGLSTAMGRSGADVSARSGARGRRLHGLTSLLKLGKNMEDTALQGLSRGGQLETSRSIAEGQAQMAERQAKSDLAGTLAGLGMSYAMRTPPGGGKMGPDLASQPKVEIGPDGWPV